MASTQRDLAALLNRGALPAAVVTQLVGQAIAKGYCISRCSHCPQQGPRIHDANRQIARCLVCGRTEHLPPAASSTV
jgi:hypothetical protein